MSLIKCRYCGEEITQLTDSIWLQINIRDYDYVCNKSINRSHKPLPESEYVTRILNQYMKKKPKSGKGKGGKC